jgi:hypothetical protein
MFEVDVEPLTDLLNENGRQVVLLMSLDSSDEDVSAPALASASTSASDPSVETHPAAILRVLVGAIISLNTPSIIESCPPIFKAASWVLVCLSSLASAFMNANLRAVSVPRSRMELDAILIPWRGTSVKTLAAPRDGSS